MLLKSAEYKFTNIECYLCRFLKRWTAMYSTLPHRSIIERVVAWTARNRNDLSDAASGPLKTFSNCILAKRQMEMNVTKFSECRIN